MTWRYVRLVCCCVCWCLLLLCVGCHFGECLTTVSRFLIVWLSRKERGVSKGETMKETTTAEQWAMCLTLNGHTTLAHGETFPSYDLAIGAALSITREGRQAWADYMGELAVEEWQRFGAAVTLAEWLGVPDTGGALWGWRVSLVADGGGK